MSIEWVVKVDDKGSGPDAFMADAVSSFRTGSIILFGDKTNSEAQAGMTISEIKTHHRLTIMINEKKELTNQGTTAPVNIHWLLMKFQDHSSFSMTISLLRGQNKTVTTVLTATFASVTVTHFRTVSDGYTFEFKVAGKISETDMKE